MPQIVPISHLKNTSEISEMCHSTKEPIFITKNGYGDMVLMSMENYERMMKLSKVYKELEELESQIEAGQTMNARKQLASMREKYGKFMIVWKKIHGNFQHVSIMCFEKRNTGRKKYRAWHIL